MGASANTSERAEDRSEEDSHGFVAATGWELLEALAIPWHCQQLPKFKMLQEKPSKEA